jgi:hypothetical protein
MINAFSWLEQAPKDQSIAFLYKVFGSVNGVLCDPDNCTATTGVSLNILGFMFKAFNGVALTIGALIVVYVTVVGVLKTAQEGEFMGKHWNSLFVPLRIVIGIGMLVPTTSGYSGIQIIIMWVIVQGIGAADYMWNTALSAAYVLGSPYAQVTLPGTSVDQTVRGLFQSLVCSETAAFAPPISDAPTEKWMSGKGSYYCSPYNPNGRSTFCVSPAAKYNIIDNKLAMGPAGSCGFVALCDQQAACSSALVGPETDKNAITTGAVSAVTGFNKSALEGSTKLRCQSCQQQWLALVGTTNAGSVTITPDNPKSILDILQPIAKAFVQADYTYRKFLEQSQLDSKTKWITDYCQANNIKPCNTTAGLPLSDDGVPVGSQGASAQATAFLWQYYPDLGPKLSQNGQVDFIGIGVSQYLGILQKAANTLIEEQIKNAGQGKKIIEDIDNTKGWIMAGSYYFYLAQTNNSNFASSMPLLSGNATMNAQILSSYRNNATAANYLTASAANAGSAGGNGSSSGMAALSSSSLAPIGSAMQSAQKTVTDVGVALSTQTGNANTNPLFAISAVGHTMMVAAEIIFGVFIGVTIALSIAGNISIFVLGNTVTNPVGGATETLYLLVVPVVFGILGWLVTMGGLLGLYIPLIPFVIFTTGAIGWLMSTLEAMIAGPLVALGVMSPSGQHEILGKAEPALMLLLNIFLRPTLMIFGMISAMVIAPVVLTLISTGYWSVVNQVGIVYDVIGFMLCLSAYVMLVAAVLNKVFSVIHVIPEKTMRWISGQPGESYGEGEVLGEQKRGVESSAGTGAAAMGKVRESEGAEKGARENQKATAEKGGPEGKGSGPTTKN